VFGSCSRPDGDQYWLGHGEAVLDNNGEDEDAHALQDAWDDEVDYGSDDDLDDDDASDEEFHLL
jgi:hypothetical protein